MYMQKLALILVVMTSLNINGGMGGGTNFSQEDIKYKFDNNIDKNQEKEEIIEITKFETHGLQLKHGISSEQVLRLKGFLRAKGYIDIENGYYFNDKMRNAVINYQKDKALQADGIVGKNTFTSINQDMELDKISIPEIQLIFTMEIPQGNWIIVNKDSNTLYYLHKEEVINRYPVATGESPSYTPEGKFTIVTKFKNPAWGGAGRHKPIRGGEPNNPLGKRWMGLNIQGGGVYGIHGNSNRESIGRYISLGCIRMFNEDVEKLYDLIPKETRVWIGSEEKLNEYGVFFNINNKEDWRNISYTNPPVLQF